MTTFLLKPLDRIGARRRHGGNIRHVTGVDRSKLGDKAVLGVTLFDAMSHYVAGELYLDRDRISTYESIYTLFRVLPDGSLFTLYCGSDLHVGHWGRLLSLIEEPERELHTLPANMTRIYAA